MRLKEHDIIERIRASFPGGLALTDDCGRIPAISPEEQLLVTTDLMESGQHFRLEWHPPELLGRKLLTINLSDVDASGAKPLGYTLTLAIGPEIDGTWLEALLKGIASASIEHQIPVLGGDTVGRPSGLGLGLTAFGVCRRWLRRDALQVGDHIYLDQMPGASLRGLRKLQAGQRWNPDAPDADLAAHLDPRPRLGLGLMLASIDEVHACIDLSDGLSHDLAMLADASGLSVAVFPGLDPDALIGGEDYVRCFSSSLPQNQLERRLDMTLISVGEVIPRGEASVLLYDGKERRPLPDLSFDHFAR